MINKLLAVLLVLTVVSGCKKKESKDDTALLAILALQSNTTCKTETLNTGGPSCQTCFGSDVPSWITDNFHCVTVTKSGTNYLFKTTNLPPHKSAYYSTSTGYNESMGAGRTKNPNNISSQNITLTIPATPTYVSSGLDSTAGIDSVGITVYGVVIFNNQAAPGDSLATEYQTMDQSEGHPQNAGKYHYHTEPYKITSDDSKLVGIMLDGYPIYGKRSQSGSYPTLDGTTNTTSCTTTHFPSGTYCYHVGHSGTNTGVDTYMIATSFRGRKGSSN
ncbi:YHYH protein [Leptospira idonii]|nr:YHYH protein [Leptospira idonii]